MPSSLPRSDTEGGLADANSAAAVAAAAAAAATAAAEAEADGAPAAAERGPGVALRVAPAALQENPDDAEAKRGDAAAAADKKDSAAVKMPAPRVEFAIDARDAASTHWHAKLVKAQEEARTIGRYKISRHLSSSSSGAAAAMDGGDGDVGAVDQERAAVIKEGYLRKKDVTLQLGLVAPNGGDGGGHHDTDTARDDDVFDSEVANINTSRQSTQRRSMSRRATRRQMKREATRKSAFTKAEYAGRGKDGKNGRRAARPGPNAATALSEELRAMAREEVVGETVVRPWQNVYATLSNDGVLRLYETHRKLTAIGSIDVNELVLEELEGLDDDFGDAAAAVAAATGAAPPQKKRGLLARLFGGGGGGHGGGGGGGGGGLVGTHQALAHGMLVNVVRGKMFQLRGGTRAHKFASPNPQVAEAWATALALCMVARYQLAPIFARGRVQIHLLDGSAPLLYKPHDSSRCGDLLRFACKTLQLHNAHEWGVHEVWDRPNMKGGASERRVPKHELLLDRTLLSWELAHRRRAGMVARCAASCYRLVLCKVALGAPMASPVPKENALEYAQALTDVTEGRFSAVADDDVYDLAALAVVAAVANRPPDDGGGEGGGGGGGGGAAAKGGMQNRAHAPQILSQLANADADPFAMSDEERIRAFSERLEGHVADFLPAGWTGVPEAALQRGSLPKTEAELQLLIEESYAELTHKRTAPDADTSKLRRLIHEATIEAELTASVARGVYVDRVRRCPHCFATDFLCEMWEGDELSGGGGGGGGRHDGMGGTAPPMSTFSVCVVVDYDGLHLYCEDGATHLSTFGFDSVHAQWVVSWLSVGNLLVVNVIASVARPTIAFAGGGAPGAGASPDAAADALILDAEAGARNPAAAEPQLAQKKLHLLSRETSVLKSLMKTYSDSVLSEHIRLEKQQAAIARAQAKVAEKKAEEGGGDDGAKEADLTA